MGRFKDWLRGHDPRTPSIEEYLRNALRELEMFADASMVGLDERASEGRVVPAVDWYLIGAAEVLAGRRGIDEDGALVLAHELLRRRGVGEEEARELLSAGLRGASHGAPGRAREEGKRTMGDWLEGKDNNAPLRLAQLVREWRS